MVKLVKAFDQNSMTWDAKLHSDSKNTSLLIKAKDFDTSQSTEQ